MALLTGLSLSWIYHHMETRTLPWPFHQVTGVKRVSRRSDVLAWMESVKVVSGESVANKNQEVKKVS
jgi:predicted DNA-binding transcriptional regulator AlpA